MSQKKTFLHFLLEPTTFCQKDLYSVARTSDFAKQNPMFLLPFFLAFFLKKCYNVLEKT